MKHITSFFVFVAIIGQEERIMMAPDSSGTMSPLAYTDQDEISKAKARGLVQNLVRDHKLHFELREYKLVGTLEVFEPMGSPLTM